ncbi:hypothetical protein JW930_04180 [Candidatus Woesearchaeota archaeon]|nr:hypothetical protein [Candidatus Woesearchaeota archaeon]
MKYSKQTEDHIINQKEEFGDLHNKIRELELKNYGLRREMFRLSQRFHNFHTQVTKTDFLKQQPLPIIPESSIDRFKEHVLKHRPHTLLSNDRIQELEDKIQNKLGGKPDNRNLLQRRLGYLEKKYSELIKTRKFDKEDLERIKLLVEKNKRLLKAG